MDSFDLPPEAIAGLRARHLAFLRSRVSSAAAREDWTRIVEGGLRELWDTPLVRVVDPLATAEALAGLLTSASVRGLFAPLAKELQVRALEAARRDRTPLGERVPRQAREAIEALLSHRDLVPDALVRELVEQDVVAQAIDDMLYDALLQFQDVVNPFFADWGLPSILRRMPLGGGLLLSSMESLRAEFDRRLEPEIRRFLGAFSRTARSGLADFFLARGGDPKVGELRRNVLDFLVARSPAELLVGIDGGAAEEFARAGEELAIGAIEKDPGLTSLAAAIEALLAEHSRRTVGQWLDAIGARERPDAAALAALTWPHVERVLGGPAFGAVLERLCDEFYDSLGATQAALPAAEAGAGEGVRKAPAPRRGKARRSPG